MLRLILILVCFSLSGFASAKPFAFSQEARIGLDAQVDFIEDPEAQLGIEDVLATDITWEANDENAFNRGYSLSAWWLRLRLSNDQAASQHRQLEIAYALLDDVQVYIVDENQRVLERYAMGDRYPFAQRPLDNRYFVIPLDWQPEQILTVYLRVQTSSAVQVPLVLWQPQALSLHEVNANIVQGLYFGAMLVIIIYNLLIFFVLWDRSYLYYVGFVVSMPLLMASITGQGFRYLWPDLAILNEYAVSMSASMTVIFANLFTAFFLKLNKRAPVLYLVTRVFVVLGLIGSLLSVTTSYYVAILYLVPLGMLSSLQNIVIGITCWWRGVMLARYYCLAWASFLIGSFVLTLNKLGILPSSWFTEYSIQIGSVLEAVLLSFALAERINAERRLRFQAQEETLTTVKRLNTELEQRVQERTEELENLNIQLRELSNTDQLTKIPNRRQLEEKLNQAWQQCVEQEDNLAVILLDIDHFKSVNDYYGHPAGDACLQQVAAKIAGCIHWDTDFLARYGGEEFCLLLPKTDSENGLVISERIRKAVSECTIVTEEHRFNITISLGICSVVPNPELRQETILKQADVALYRSKQEGRNRSTVYRPDDYDNIASFPLSK